MVSLSYIQETSNSDLRERPENQTFNYLWFSRQIPGHLKIHNAWFIPHSSWFFVHNHPTFLLWCYTTSVVETVSWNSRRPTRTYILMRIVLLLSLIWMFTKRTRTFQTNCLQTEDFLELDCIWVYLLHGQDFLKGYLSMSLLYYARMV